VKFVNATLKSIKAIEKVDTSRSLLSRVNPETKLLSLIIVLFLMIFLHSLFALLLLLLFLVVEALLFERGVFAAWLFVPLFTGMIAIPAIFMVPGEPIFHFYFLTATYEGLRAAALLIIRTLIAVTAVTLLTKTTRWEDVIASLELIRLPRVFILILFLTFRYIFFFARIIESTLLSIKSRVIGKEKSTSTWKLYAPLIGNLFVKSYEMQEKVYMSMLSRGFMLTESEKKRDVHITWSYLAVFFALAIVLVGINGGALWQLPL